MPVPHACDPVEDGPRAPQLTGAARALRRRVVSAHPELHDEVQRASVGHHRLQTLQHALDDVVGRTGVQLMGEVLARVGEGEAGLRVIGEPRQRHEKAPLEGHLVLQGDRAVGRDVVDLLVVRVAGRVHQRRFALRRRGEHHGGHVARPRREVIEGLCEPVEGRAVAPHELEERLQQLREAAPLGRHLRARAAKAPSVTL